MKRNVAFVALLVFAGAAPYLVLERGWGRGMGGVKSPESQLSSGPLWPTAKAQSNQSSNSAANPWFGATTNGSSQIIPQGNVVAPWHIEMPVQNLTEVLRFDVTPAWITQRWSRVSTAIAEGELGGMRVALVTGTNTQDLCGSLTYFFDRKSQVQRIQFDGVTGDQRRLIDLVTRYYQLGPDPTLGGGYYVAKWKGEPLSVMRVAHPTVVRRDAPQAKYSVYLELNRPNSPHGLSPTALGLLPNTEPPPRSS